MCILSKIVHATCENVIDTVGKEVPRWQIL